jgi:hypothetical protein
MGAQWSPPRPGYRPDASLPLPPGAPVPPLPMARRKGRALLLVGAGTCLVIAVALASVAAVQFSASRNPSSVAKRYFAAVASGDAAAALAFASAPPTADTGPFLTAAVLAQQRKVAPISGISVSDTVISGSSATVSVHYTLTFPDGPKSRTDRVQLVKRGSSWRLDRVGGVVSLGASAAGSDRLTFVGRPIPPVPVQLFPGAVPVATDSPSVLVSDDPAVSLGTTTSVIALRPTLSDAARQLASDGVETALRKCLAVTSTDPLCPMIEGGRPVPGSLHGTLTKKIAASDPTVTLASAGKGIIAINVEASVKASWKVWDFNNQQVARSESTTVTIVATSSVDSPQTVEWVPAHG